MAELSGIIWWDTEAPDTEAQLEELEHFDARGMKRVYGRGDRFANYRRFNMDIWKTSGNALMMRFWSLSSEVDWRSYEIKGVDVDTIPERQSLSEALSSAWVPQAVRDEYENWIMEEY